ncbi:MAG: tetratricopeptide repeat protein [Blastocatellia bacterium]|nr:tetratricopeptide repeat protein [Blastocatellia bacterium]
MADTSTRDFAMSLFQKAYKAQMAGKLEEAIDLYKQSIDVMPTAEAHTFLGWTYSFQNRLDEAIEECFKAIEVDSTFGNPYNDIGVYLMEKGDHVAAVPWLKRAMVAPRYECYFYPHYNLGRIYEKQGKLIEAMGCYSRAVEYNPNYKLAIKSIRKLQKILN